MTQTVTTKQELIDYLGNIHLGEGKELTEKSDEIMKIVKILMKDASLQEGWEIFRRYYEPRLTELEEARSQKDSRGFIHALAGLYNLLKGE